MQAQIELETDAVDEAELRSLESQFETCFVFAFAYAESRNDAVVKSTEVDGTGHCYVHDRDRDVTIDATLGQFRGCPAAGAWDGDHHPHVDGGAEIEEFETRSVFEEEHIKFDPRELPQI